MADEKHCVVISFGKQEPSQESARYRFTATEKCPLGHSGCRSNGGGVNYCTSGGRNGLRAICFCNSGGLLRANDVKELSELVSNICGGKVMKNIISDLSVRAR